ncbi:transposase, partial [Pseudomonas veronii]
MTKQRRTFSPEFKREAADLVLKQDYSFIEASRSLGVGESALRRWVDQVQQERTGVTPQSKALTPEQQKIQELEARIARLEREKSILKNRLPGAPRPIGLETLRSTLILLDSGRWLFGGLVPVKKLD